MEQLEAKTIHGVFIKNSRVPTRDFKAMHMWLRSGRECAETEALVIAAQDGARHIRLES